MLPRQFPVTNEIGLILAVVRFQLTQLGGVAVKVILCAGNCRLPIQDGRRIRVDGAPVRGLGNRYVGILSGKLRPFTAAAVRYFDLPDLAAATKWLDEAKATPSAA